MSKLSKDTMINFLKMLSCNGYKVYLTDNSDKLGGTFYAHIITPSDNVMYIKKNSYNVGWDFYLEYVPSQKHGSGCKASEQIASYELTLDKMKEIEQEGLNFAFKLGAEKYKSSKAWFNKYWDKDNLKEIKAEMSLEEFLNFFDFSYTKELNKDKEEVFKLIDDQGANLGGIEGEKFSSIVAITDRLDIYYHDYIYQYISEKRHTIVRETKENYKSYCIECIEEGMEIISYEDYIHEFGYSSQAPSIYEGEEDYPTILKWMEDNQWPYADMISIVRCIVYPELIYEGDSTEARQNMALLPHYCPLCNQKIQKI